MSQNDPSGFDAEDLERFARAAAEQLREGFGQFGKLLGGTGAGTGRSGVFDGAGRRTHPHPEPQTTGETGDGVWVIYTLDSEGSARVEQVHATELDALRANKNNTDVTRRVRFLPYGMAANVLDLPEEPRDS